MAKKKKELTKKEKQQLKQEATDIGTKAYNEAQGNKNSVADIIEPIPEKIPALAEVSGYKARPFGGALKLIFGSWAESQTTDSSGKEVPLDEQPSMVEYVAVMTYLIFSPDIKQIWKLSRKSERLSEFGFNFIDKLDDATFEAMSEYVTGALSDLGGAEEDTEEDTEDKKK